MHRHLEEHHTVFSAAIQAAESLGVSQEVLKRYKIALEGEYQQLKALRKLEINSETKER